MKHNKIIYALDYETFYSKDCSITKLGPLGYFSHPEFDAYMVSVVGSDGFTFVGHPKDFDWSLLAGNVVISHNAGFDHTLYLYGVTQKWWPEVEYDRWVCTADMCAAVGLPRSLKNASAQAFGLDVSKATRDNMKGKRWVEMSDEFQKEVSEYALKDSELCLQLWQKYSEEWSEFEQAISEFNRSVAQRGVPMNPESLQEAREEIGRQLFEAESSIPWNGDRPLLSRKAFDEECIKCGIEPPASLAKTDKDAQEWIAKHGQKYRWVAAVSNWRRINSLSKKLDAFDSGTMPDNRYYGNIKYYGGHTGRFSGSGGNLNLQNMPREEMFGVNMRNLIEAPKGKKLVVADLSQIEVRTLCWLAGDTETLAEIEASDDIYEAFAIRFGVWSKDKGVLKKKDPALRHDVKAMTIGCGYGSGPHTFAAITDMPLAKAEKAVALYRRKLSKIPAYWRKLNREIRTAHTAGAPLSFELPSGNVMNYGKLRQMRFKGKSQYVAMVERNGKRLPMKLYGGVVVENLSQKLARDIFCHMMLEIDKSGENIILHVHDEVVVECDEDRAEEVAAKLTKIMSTPPDWIPDIPLDSEGDILDRYQK